MTTFTDEQLSKAYETAPAAVRAFIEEGMLSTALLSIKEGENLSSQSLPDLGNIAINVLTGLVPVTKIAEELAGTPVPPPAAGAVAKKLADLVAKAALPHTYTFEETVAEVAPAAPKTAPVATPAPVKPSTPSVPPDHLLPKHEVVTRSAPTPVTGASIKLVPGAPKTAQAPAAIVPATTPAPTPAPVATVTPKPTPAPVVEKKAYPVDPYREPVE